MQIEVKNNVFWDTEKVEQSPAAMQWMLTEIMPQMKTPAATDENGRPMYWQVVYNKKITVRVEYQYKHANSTLMAKTGMVFTVTESE